MNTKKTLSSKEKNTELFTVECQLAKIHLSHNLQILIPIKFELRCNHSLTAVKLRHWPQVFLLLNMKSQVVLKLDSATNSLGRIINMPKRDKTHAQLHNIE